MKSSKFSPFSRCMALALLSMSAACSSWALGLGEARVQSAIGQPLVADIELLADAAELGTVRLGLAGSAEYQLQGLEYSPVLSGARVVIKKNEAGKTVAQITGRVSVSEPYVQVIMDGESVNGKVRRAYSIFVDPNRKVINKLPGEGSFMEVTKSVGLPLIQDAGAPAIPAMPAIKGVVAKSVDAPAVATPAPNGVVLTNITERGKAPERIDNVKGYGRKQAISHALFTIVPKGWKGFANDSGVKFAKPVDWEGNRSWLTVLDGVLASAHLTAAVDWDKKEITFSSLQPQEAAAQAQAEKAAPVEPQRAATSTTAPSAVGAQQAAQTAALNHQLDKHKERVESLEKEVTTLKAKVASSSDEIARAQTDRSLMATELSMIKQSQGRADDELDRARQELTLVRTQLKEAQKRIDSAPPAPLPGQIEQAQESARALTAEVATLRKNLAAAQEKVLAAEKKVSELNSALEIRAQQNEKLLARLDALQNERSNSQSQSAGLQADLAKAKTALEQANSSGQQWQMAASKAQAELSALQSESTKNSADHATHLVDLRDQVNSLKKQLSAEAEARAKAQEEAKKLSESLAATQQRLASTTNVFVKKQEPVAMPSTTQLTLVGPALSDEKAVMTSGMNVAFPNAIKQIIPQGWMVTTDPSIGNLSVAWNGSSRPWPQVLDDLLKSKGLKAKIDSVTHEIYIGR